jgi:hypothetical protein
MPRREAVRQFSKVDEPCPRCGSTRPKELVEGRETFETGIYLVVALLSCGLGALFPSLFRQRPLRAYCERCDTSFALDASGRAVERRDRRRGRSGWGGVRVVGCAAAVVCVLACCGVGMFVSERLKENLRRDLAQANAAWDAGRKDDAVAGYEKILGRIALGVPDERERPVVYARVIEYRVERGDADAAKAHVEKALDMKVELPPVGPATAELVAAVRARREAEEKAKREAEAKRLKEEREKASARMSVEIVKARLEPFRTPDGTNTRLVCVDFKNTGNRPVRVVDGDIKVFDPQEKLLFSVNYTLYAESDQHPGIAPGETHVRPPGRGFILPPMLRGAIRVEVTITKVKEQSGL